jgi:beta-lactamase regulating signal transducer with metallopeptidase domain
MPGLKTKWRWTLPVNPGIPQSEAFSKEVRALKLIRSQSEVQTVIKEKRLERKLSGAPPWERHGSPSFTAADVRMKPWSQIEAHIIRVWWGVACGLFSLTILRTAFAIGRKRRLAASQNSDVVAISLLVSQLLNIKAKPRIYIDPSLQSPLLLGTLEPQILLPSNADAWSPEKLRAVFLHELAHFHRRDHLWMYIGKLVKCCFWWNPLAASAARRMAAEAEEAADDAVLLYEMDATSYATALVEIASENVKRNAFASGISMIGKDALEKRIKALLAVNPWRGKLGARGGWLIAGLFLASVCGAALHFQNDGGAESTNVDGPQLTPSQRSSLQRIIDANTNRLTQLRFIHFKLESTSVETINGATSTAPQPTKMEAWVDQWTGIHRAEFRPRVLRWSNGSAPFYIENSTQINDGKKLYTLGQRDDREIPRGRDPEGLDQYLGAREMTDVIRMSKALLSMKSLNQGMFSVQFDQEERDGKQLTRIREQYLRAGKVTQQRTLLVDPAQDEMVVFSELAFPAIRPEAPNQWMVVKCGKTATGTLYPEIYKTVHSINGKEVTNITVTSLEILNSLPDGLTDLPTPASSQYVSKNGTAMRHEGITFHFYGATDRRQIPKVKVKYGINDEQTRELVADEAGKVVISLPKDEIRKLAIWAESEGFAKQVVSWRKYGDPLQLPASYKVTLSPIAPIFGKIVNETNEPIQGAELEVLHYGARSNSGVFSDHVSVRSTMKTANNGRWELKDVPQNLEGLMIRASAPGYQPTTEFGVGDFRTLTGMTYESLRDGSCVITLKQGVTLLGSIKDTSGNPVPKCRVTIGKDRWGTNLPTTESDDLGNFALDGLSPKKAWLTVESPIHKPFAAELTFPLKEPLKITLEPGKLLHGVVLKEDGSPCVGLNVGADKWRSLRTLTFETQTDANGRKRTLCLEGCT